jgi:predicted PurR-regulated permease PerM
MISLVVAGVLLAHREGAAAAATAIARRLGGPRGEELLGLAAATVQSVTRGILGVALIQSVLAGIAMLAVGVPAAGLWALAVMLLAVVQLPTLLVLLPVTFYVFSATSTGIAIAFAVWSLLVGLIDNVLKPILLGRGVDVPMLVIFLGAIGGFLLEGIIGLFVGAVVLAVSHRLFQEWVAGTPEEAASVASPPTANPD